MRDRHVWENKYTGWLDRWLGWEGGRGDGKNRMTGEQTKGIPNNRE